MKLTPKLEDYIPSDFPQMPDVISDDERELHKLIEMNVPDSAIKGDTVELEDRVRVLMPETREAFEAMLPPVNDAVIQYARFRVYTDSPRPAKDGGLTLNLRDELLANMDIIDSKPPYDEAMAQEIRSAFARMEHLAHEYKEQLLRKVDRVVELNSALQLVNLHQKIEPAVNASEFLTRFEELYPLVPEADRTNVERNIVLANRRGLGIANKADAALFDQYRGSVVEQFKAKTPALAELFMRVEAIDATMSHLHAELTTLSEGCQERLLPNALEQRDALDHLSIANGTSRTV